MRIAAAPDGPANQRPQRGAGKGFRTEQLRPRREQRGAQQTGQKQLFHNARGFDGQRRSLFAGGENTTEGAGRKWVAKPVGDDVRRL